jgi:uncharacterized membrane protein
MKNPADHSTIGRAEYWISLVLRSGVILCGAVLGAGLLKALAFPESTNAPTSALLTRLLQNQVLDDFHPISSASELIHGLLRFDSVTLMTLGILLLIALPIFRVAFTGLVFLYERDWTFVLICLTVLGVLLTGIFLGRAL